jgi:hypothetical protein
MNIGSQIECQTKAFNKVPMSLLEINVCGILFPLMRSHVQIQRGVRYVHLIYILSGPNG